jgi:DNA-binding transcriptional LysR family regulator
MVDKALMYFAKAAEHGSIHEAARALHVAQSAVSRQILKLESHWGMALLERHARGIKLTAAGDVLMRHARDSFHQAQRMRTELDALRGLPRGRIRLHAIESVVQDFLPLAASRFCARHAGVVFDIAIDGTDQIVLALREGRADIGITFCAPPDRHLITLFKAREPMLALLRAGHSLARRKIVTLDEALRFPIALPMRNSGSRMLIDAACKATKRELRPVLETNSVQFLVRFVRHSDAITFLPRLSAGPSLKAGDVVGVPVRDPLLASATIETLTLARRKLSPAVDEFQRFLRAEFQSLPVARWMGARPEMDGRTE